ncbi:tetratricopeptide repeat protein [Sphaerotilus sp.]|uniref:tetratricopeptide repeat protein n=1 Tax=Sphaerotilus sp. TaxID=2093942 RepID=UPI002ACDF32A|nr:tetratricopeptide repeat protein [Sphaerotilus sp.]MDZ7858146.1 tetratricopeptide repeat protein [Sphaerotilus sp.]
MPTLHTPSLRHGFSVLLLACLPMTAAWAGYDDGVAAYQRGQHGVALKEFSDAAARGDARAQRSLGLMHERGDGVPRDPALAAEWYRKAIAQGLPGAQYNLAFVTQAPTAGAPAPVQVATSHP